VRRHEQEELLDIAQCVVQLDYAIRDIRVLARVVVRLMETGAADSVALACAQCARALARSVRALDGHLAGEYDATLAARAHATTAARRAASVQHHVDDVVVLHLVGQMRSTVVDLLRATGMSRSSAIDVMLDATRHSNGA
jgi:hypothetical protein